jgi:perosamine synthetase
MSAYQRIPICRPSITEREVSYAEDAARNGWGPKCYEYVERFETQFKAYAGSQYAIATSSCTGALHIGLKALGIGPGDEVILADTNWIATVAPVCHLGAAPIFVDILPDTWCLDPVKVEEAITPNTKAIIAVHLYGNLCDMDSLLEIGRRHDIPVVEDAAEAIGSVYKGRNAGTMGAFGAFSFHGTKTITTGEGGMLITNNAALYETALTLSNHGRSRNATKQFWPEMVGFKYKMSNIQAAIGCGQLERIQELTTRKRDILAYYITHLRGCTSLSFNSESEGTVNGAWMPTVVFATSLGITREMLLPAFAEANIDARVFFYPLSSVELFRAVPNNVNAWDLPTRAINLPSYHDMTDGDQDRIIAILQQFISKSQRKHT